MIDYNDKIRRDFNGFSKKCNAISSFRFMTLKMCKTGFARYLHILAIYESFQGVYFVEQ